MCCRVCFIVIINNLISAVLAPPDAFPGGANLSLMKRKMNWLQFFPFNYSVTFNLSIVSLRGLVPLRGLVLALKMNSKRHSKTIRRPGPNWGWAYSAPLWTHSWGEGAGCSSITRTPLPLRLFVPQAAALRALPTRFQLPRPHTSRYLLTLAEMAYSGTINYLNLDNSLQENTCFLFCMQCLITVHNTHIAVRRVSCKQHSKHIVLHWST